MKTMISTIFTVLSLASAAVEAGEMRPATVELFTSQGCSSCPPADEYLREIAERSDVIALAWHVDYWDRLGWPDRYGLAEATRRQSLYRSALGLRSLYTPQTVIDGRIDAVGSDRGRIAPLLREQPAERRIELQMDETGIRLSSSGGGPASLLVLGVLSRAETAVGRGENSGRKLIEANIVRSVELLNAPAGESRHHLPWGDVAEDADRIAVLAQDGDMRVLGAAWAVRPWSTGGKSPR